MFLKEIKWQNFSLRVKRHIIEYAIPQYGEDNDIAEDYTYEECMLHIKKYLARSGNNTRLNHDKLDCLKIAHYAQMAYDKLEKDA